MQIKKNMNKVIYLTFTMVIFSVFSSMAQFDKLKKNIGKRIESVSVSSANLSQQEVGSGLKEALTKGVEKGVSQLSKPDGFFKDLSIKIPLPVEANKVESKLRSLGQGRKVDQTIESINRAAEDATNILRVEVNAATAFLDKSTRAELISEFEPIVKTSLDKVGATKNWKTIFTNYNKLPFVQNVNPNLVSYATKKAIDGLFIQIAKEELNIRQNPSARGTALLKKVFGET